MSREDDTTQRVGHDPVWLTLAIGQLGVREYTARRPGPNGEQSNPVVEQYQREAGQVHTDDEVAWCASFVSSMLFRAGMKHLGTGARSYARYGERLAQPQRGCIASMYRGDPHGTKGHVTFFVQAGPCTVQLTGPDGRVHTARAGAGEFVGLGGNQHDEVTVAAYDLERVLGFRWPVPA